MLSGCKMVGPVGNDVWGCGGNRWGLDGIRWDFGVQWERVGGQGSSGDWMSFSSISSSFLGIIKWLEVSLFV